MVLCVFLRRFHFFPFIFCLPTSLISSYLSFLHISSFHVSFLSFFLFGISFSLFCSLLPLSLLSIMTPLPPTHLLLCFFSFLFSLLRFLLSLLLTSHHFPSYLSILTPLPPTHLLLLCFFLFSSTFCPPFDFFSLTFTHLLPLPFLYFLLNLFYFIIFSIFFFFILICFSFSFHLPLLV